MCVESNTSPDRQHTNNPTCPANATGRPTCLDAGAFPFSRSSHGMPAGKDYGVNPVAVTNFLVRCLSEPYVERLPGQAPGDQFGATLLPRRYMKQVARTMAVRRAEARAHCSQPGQVSQQSGPLALEPRGSRQHPCAGHCGTTPQVVQMPARPVADGAVMRDSRAQSAGSQGTADVQIYASAKIQSTQRTDPDSAGTLDQHLEDVGTGKGGHRVRRHRNDS